MILLQLNIERKKIFNILTDILIAFWLAKHKVFMIFLVELNKAALD